MKKSVFSFCDKSLALGEKTYVMGIINITPDSFSDGGVNFSLNSALNSARLMKEQGADIIDIGAQSTRPGCKLISPKEEWERLKEILPVIINEVNLPVSVDTFYPFVAKKALEAGCDIINDVSGIVTPEMTEIINCFSAGYVIMHNTPENGEICFAVHNRLKKLLNEAMALGVKRECICLDPGIGFNKTNEQNLKLLADLKSVAVEGNALLLGASRKRVIGNSLKSETPFNKRDYGTVAAHTIGIMGGADIIRVHNVFAACQGAQVADEIKRSR